MAGPYFSMARASAANMPYPGEHGDYTAELFQEDFPQFTRAGPEEGEKTAAESLIPEKMLEIFISQANDSVLPSRWGSMWRYAAGLYTAHFAALYLKTYSP